MASGGAVVISDVLTWLNDPSHWRDSSLMTGIASQLQTHLWYSALAIAIGLVIALPLGLYLGHTGRMAWLVSAGNGVRALPQLGLLILLAVIIAPHFHGRTHVGYIIPVEIVLTLLAIPPILSNTYAGVQNIDPAVVDAARGMGMTDWQVVRRVEIACSLPLIFSGLRSASLQVIATATIAAVLPLGGLGRFIIDGQHQQDYPQMIGGGVLVAALALFTELVLATIQRFAVSRGLSGRFPIGNASK